MGGSSVSDAELLDNARKTRAPNSSTLPGKAQTIGLLDKLAAANPEIFERLNLYMFTGDLEPVMDNWKLLGLDEQDASAVADHLKSVMASMRSQELEGHRVLAQTDKSVTVALPAPSPEVAQRRREEIEAAFSASFDPTLSKIFAKRYIDGHPSTCASLTGNERIVTLSLTSDEVYKQTGRQFTMNVRTLTNGVNADLANQNLDMYTANNDEILLPTIPENWSHLFNASK